MTGQTKVWPIEDMGYLIRGTDNPRKARYLAWQRALADGWYVPGDARYFVGRAQLKPGWYRTNPCQCGNEHSFDIVDAPGPGRGNFRGVAVDLGWMG